MVIENGTAAGPSRGILDVLFGTKGPEDDADGKGFKPIMDMIKALNGEGKKEGESRTDEETEAGKGMADAQTPIPPVFIPFMPETFSAEALKAEPQGDQASMEGMVAKNALLAAVPGKEQIQAGDVNQLLQSNGFAKLSKEEEKLLEQVNLKLAALPPVIVPAALAKGENPVKGEITPQAQMTIGQEAPQSSDPILDADMLKKGKLGKAIESANPNKAEAMAPFVSTESFLGLLKDKQGQKIEQPVEQELPRINDKSGATSQTTNLLKESVKGMETNSNLSNFTKDFLSEAGNLEKKDRLTGDSILGAAGFSSALKGELMTKDLHIQTVDPQQIRSALLTEVDQNIHFQALKGGGEMKIVIHPEELGEVKLHVASKNGQIDVKIQAENEAVASIIRDGSKELEGALKDRNLTLAKIEVSVSDGVMASSDSKPSSGDQMFQQSQDQQAGRYFGSGTNAERQDTPAWGRQQYSENPRYSSNYETNSTKTSESRSVSSNRDRAKDSSRRLDVVA